jgi:hypothetical protein
MANILAIALLTISFIGIVILIFKRVPELVVSDEEEREGEEKDLPKKFSLNNFLRKALMKFKVFIQKTENKTSSAIKKLGEKSKKEENSEKGDYWKKLKKK